MTSNLHYMQLLHFDSPSTIEQVSADVKKNVMESNTSTAAGAPYNRLNHGANTTQAQPRLAKVEGLGYDALDN